MTTSRGRTFGLRKWAAVAGVFALSGVLAACGGSQDAAESSESGDAAAAVVPEGESSLLVWGWDPGLEPVAEAFMEKYPNVKVDVVNVGTNDDHYTKLQNSIAAGSGAPDVAQMEYQALPQFAISGGLYDLNESGLDSLEANYTPAAWASVHSNGGLYGLPIGTGPMALFYNKAVFDAHGVEVPTTWEEYADAARKLKEADPKIFITNDNGDAGFTTSLIWQAGGRPFSSEGTDVTVNFEDEGTKLFTETWQPMIDEGLVAPISSWSDEWYQGLANGTIATLVIGAWMAGNLESGVPDGAGDWAVAPMPAFKAGDKTTAENGGGGISVIEQSKNKEVAAAFVSFATNEGQQIFLDTVGGIPSTVADLSNQEWLDQEWEYFGGQKINQIFAESANSVGEGWQYLPFQVYANSIFGDTVGKAYLKQATLEEGLAEWQKQLIAYGDEQGFTVK